MQEGLIDQAACCATKFCHRNLEWQKLCAFSLAYAAAITLAFEPGLLYSDSVVRWNTAIDLAKNGLISLRGYSDHHPALPILLMAATYKLGGSLHLFSFLQAFFFSFFFLLLVCRLSPNLWGLFFGIVALLLPVNLIYSIFISNDTLFAVFLCALLLALLSKGRQKLFSIPILAALLLGTRLNFLVVTPLLLIVLFQKTERFSLVDRAASCALFLIMSALVISLPSILQMQKGNSWLIGTAWEYPNIAIKSGDREHIAFLQSFGASPHILSEGICYHGIWCGREREEFISKVGGREREVLEKYAALFVEYPQIFIDEKLKYAKSLLGLGDYKLSNAEIGRWREPFWRDAMMPLGFKSTTIKEKLVDLYFIFSHLVADVLFRPYLIIGMLLILAFFMTQFGLNLVSITLIVVSYYLSYLISAQNHEFRYFFPVVFVFFAFLSATLALVVERVLLKVRSRFRETVIMR